MTTLKQKGLSSGPLKPGVIVIRATMLAISCVASFWLITHMLADIYSVSRADNLLGGMWAVVSTIFVYRYSQAESFDVALSRMSATIISFVLCSVYLRIFPFHVLGMAALIAIGAIAVGLIGRPDDTIATSITTAVVLVVASTRGPDDAWRQPILRLVDTAIGVIVGVASAWVCQRAIQSMNRMREFQP
jgi:uncharacterized membrane protein YccC